MSDSSFTSTMFSFLFRIDLDFFSADFAGDFCTFTQIWSESCFQGMEFQYKHVEVALYEVLESSTRFHVDFYTMAAFSSLFSTFCLFCAPKIDSKRPHTMVELHLSDDEKLSYHQNRNLSLSLLDMYTYNSTYTLINQKKCFARSNETWNQHLKIKPTKNHPWQHPKPRFRSIFS